MVINGSLPNPSSGIFNRRTADNATQICSGDSIHDDVRYQAYAIVNVTDEAHTVDIELTRDFGSILEPVLHIYSSFDPP